jgi:2'-5' RNA ligase
MEIKISNSGGRVKDLSTVHLTIFPIGQIVQHRMKLIRKEAIQIKNETPFWCPRTHGHDAWRERGRIIVYCLACREYWFMVYLTGLTWGFTALDDGTVIFKE